MHPFFIYLIQVNIALALFYLLYAIMLKSDTFLRLRRFFFLSAILFSLLYPFWSVPVLGDLGTSLLTPEKTEAAILIGETSVTVVEEGQEAGTTAIPWVVIVMFLYVAITGLFLFRLMVQLVSLLRLKKRCERSAIAGVPVYRLKDPIAPFSFFNRIFIHAGQHSETELSQILLHEQTHARQWHSIDIMLMEGLCLFSWWNPFVWLMKREMAINLEYLADQAVLHEGVDSREYQYHLLQLTYQESMVQIVNNFNMSQLKQRIMMMNKTKSPSLKLAKYLLVIPLAFLLLLANSCKNQEKKSDADTPAESAVEAPDSKTATDVLPEVTMEDKSEVFVVVEEQPEFPGGNAAMMRFLSDNIKYPVEAQEKGLEGRVICNFVVEKDGSLTDFNIVRGVDPLLDNEALRILKSMPQWKPGKQRGEHVRVRFTLPVVFRLEKKNSGAAPPPPPPPPPAPASATSNEVFVVVEKQPLFPGGNEAMMKFISDNVEYPTEAQEKGIQGRVICNFVVEKDGSLSDIEVVRGVDPSLDKEAVRIIQSMPKWKPGVQKDEAVRVRFTLPIVFRLQN